MYSSKWSVLQKQSLLSWHACNAIGRNLNDNILNLNNTVQHTAAVLQCHTAVRCLCPQKSSSVLQNNTGSLHAASEGKLYVLKRFHVLNWQWNATCFSI